MSTGIVNPGTPVTRNCLECKTAFETHTGVVTIKGPAPDMELCRTCYEKDQKEAWKSVFEALARKSDTNTNEKNISS